MKISRPLAAAFAAIAVTAGAGIAASPAQATPAVPAATVPAGEYCGLGPIRCGQVEANRNSPQAVIYVKTWKWGNHAVSAANVAGNSNNVGRLWAGQSSWYTHRWPDADGFLAPITYNGGRTFCRTWYDNANIPGEKWVFVPDNQLAKINDVSHIRVITNCNYPTRGPRAFN